MRWTAWSWRVLGLILISSCSADLRFDSDGDGVEDLADCAPDDPAIHREADDPWDDAIDQNCDGIDGTDSDQDDFAREGGDCADDDPLVHPDASEIVGNSTDEDCDGLIDLGRPTAPTLSLQPDPARTGDTLVASIVTPSTDPQGEALTYRFTWTRNVDPYLGAADADTQSVVPGADVLRGDFFRVVVVANDGTHDSEEAEATLLIDNGVAQPSPPVLSPDPLRTLDEALCVATLGADPDGDVAVLRHRWTVNGIEQAEQNQTLPGATAFDRGDLVQCSVWSDDGFGEGDPVDSGLIMVANSPPSVGPPSLLPVTITAATTLVTATPGTITDDDGDSVTLAIDWSMDGLPLATGETTGGPFVRGLGVTVVVTPHDGIEPGVPTSRTLVVENAPPVVTDVGLDLSPTAAAPLTSSPTGFDPDGDPVSFAYSWMVDGVPIAATGASLPAGSVLRGSVVECTVTPSDGWATGAPVVATTTILNAPPTVTPEIDPIVPTALSGVMLVGTVEDADGDAVTVDVEWFVDGVSQGLSTGLAQLGDAAMAPLSFVRGQSLEALVTPWDGIEFGATVPTSTVVAENSPPSLGWAVIDPAAPGVTDTITCSPMGVVDADGDPLDFTWLWSEGSTALIGQDTLLSPVTRGMLLNCLMTASDGIDSVELGEGQAEVANTPATVVSATLIPDPATAADDMECLAGTVADADGDSPVLHWVWALNGTDQGIDQGTLPAELATRGDAVQCAVRADDGFDPGAIAASAVVVLGNAVPVFEALVMNPSTPTAASGAAASATVTDSDGDNVFVDVEWSIDGSVWSFWDNQDPDSLPPLGPGSFVRGQQVELRARCDDNIDVSTWSIVGPVTVGNSPPQDASVSLLPPVPTVGASVRCQAVAGFDWDGDAVTLSLSWWVNGSPWTGATSTTVVAGDTIPAGTVVDGDQVSCSVDWDDGFGGVGTVEAMALVGGSGPCASPRNDLWIGDLASGSGYSDIANAVSLSGDGILLVGDQQTSADHNTSDARIRLLSDDGDDLGGTTITGSQLNYLEDLLVHPSGGWLALGTKYVSGQGYQRWLQRVDGNGTPGWTSTWGGTNNEWGSYAADVGDGVIVGTGYTSPPYGWTNATFWAQKFDWDGNVLWSQWYPPTSWGQTAYGIAGTLDGGALLVGLLRTSAVASTAQGHAVRIADNGDELWQLTWGGAAQDVLRDAVELPDGGFLAVGDTNSSSAGGSDGWIVRIDSAGNVLWERNHGTANDDGWMRIEAAGGGRFYVVGYHDVTGTPTGAGWLLMIDAWGNVLWERDFESGTYVQLNGLALGPDGDVIVSGQSNPNSGPWGFYAARTDGWGHADCGVAGVCSSLTPGLCASDNPCTAPTCDPLSGCGEAPLPDGARCDDAAGSCQGGTCVP